MECLLAITEEITAELREFQPWENEGLARSNGGIGHIKTVRRQTDQSESEVTVRQLPPGRAVGEESPMLEAAAK
jgi:hypothetical protein